ncbi:hypothetical protein Tco_0719868 [Tanacetum coccineum]
MVRREKEDVGLDELGEGGKEVVSKIGEFGGDIGSELLGDRGGEVLFGGGEGGEVFKESRDGSSEYEHSPSHGIERIEANDSSENLSVLFNVQNVKKMFRLSSLVISIEE